VQELAFSGLRVGSGDIPPVWRERAVKAFMRRPKPVVLREQSRPTKRAWAPGYAAAAKEYPTVEQLGRGAGLSPDDITDAAAESCLNDPSGNGAGWLTATLAVLRIAGDVRLKPLALRCAKPGLPVQLRAEAFRILVAMGQDADTERLFIDYLLEENDPRSVLRRIAEGYFGE
jgi:hypothetical protein